MLTFVESPAFTKQCTDLWSDAEYSAFQHFLAARPEAGDLIPGLGGLRKVRWSAKGRGKRGGSAGDLPTGVAAGAHLRLPSLHEGRHCRPRAGPKEATARGR